MSPRFKKRPVEVEAIQWTGKNVREVQDFVGTRGHDGVTVDMLQGWVEIPTLDGLMRAKPGDWIIRGVAQELYPCKPEIFEKTYELITPEGYPLAVLPSPTECPSRAPGDLL